MSLNFYNVKKWTKMLTGKSVLHVDQGVGRNYKKDAIAGYYNDLTEKVTKSNLGDGRLPVSSNEKNKAYYFPIAIFQYGLGAYDLYLQTGNKRYLKMVKDTADWAVKNQDENGGWDCFHDDGEKNSYSAMGQGEGISLLARAYVALDRGEYLESIKKASSCMIKSIDDGGTMLCNNTGIVFKEFPEKPVVLNGWIFSIFGLYDYLLLFPRDRKIKATYEKSLKTLKNRICTFDLGYWSKYDDCQKIASPFYHKLHVSLLTALYDLTAVEVFYEYARKFDDYNSKKINKMRAFVEKSFQKLMER